MNFENEIEHKILVTYVIAKVSARIRVGDRVFGKDEASGEMGYKPVTANYNRIESPGKKYRKQDGD